MAQIDHFSNDLDRLIERYREEYDLTYGEMVGALQFRAFLLMQEAYNVEQDEDDGQ